MTKNHLGFIADEIMKVIPPEWEHIVMTDNEGSKKFELCKIVRYIMGCLQGATTKDSTQDRVVREFGLWTDWRSKGVERKETTKGQSKSKG